MFPFKLAPNPLLMVCPCSIVEFSSQEDAQRAVRELSEQPLLGRPVFIREVVPHSCIPSLNGSLTVFAF